MRFFIDGRLLLIGFCFLVFVTAVRLVVVNIIVMEVLMTVNNVKVLVVIEWVTMLMFVRVFDANFSLNIFRWFRNA